MNRREQQHIIYIMLSTNEKINVTTAKPSPTLPYRPPTLFFSVNNPMHPLCPPIF